MAEKKRKINVEESMNEDSGERNINVEESYGTEEPKEEEEESTTTDPRYQASAGN